MKKELRDGHRRAVDMLLDRPFPISSAPTRAGEVTARDLRDVEGVLSVLESMPAPEPAADLVSRTMARIERHQGSSAAPIVESAAADTRPL